MDGKTAIPIFQEIRDKIRRGMMTKAMKTLLIELNRRNISTTDISDIPIDATFIEV